MAPRKDECRAFLARLEVLGQPVKIILIGEETSLAVIATQDQVQGNVGKSATRHVEGP